MIDRLNIALRSFERIRQLPSDPLGRGNLQELSRWLEQDVGAVVEDLVERPDFQAAAPWPLDHLRPDASAEERRLVDAVDADLVTWAMQLAEWARGPVVWEALFRQEVPEAFRADLRAVETIARRPWRDLVVLSDYFSPASDLTLTDREQWLGPNSRQVQVGEFVTCWNPWLSSLGDFVSRTVLTRVDYWRRVVQGFGVRCQTALANGGRCGGDSWETVHVAQGRLQDHYDQLRDRCLFAREARLRNACIALLQVYADYRPRVRLEWLGLPPPRRPLGLRRRVERPHDGVGEQVAAALLDAVAMFRSAVDVTSLIEARARRHPLVVVMGRGRRETYWQGQLVPADWAVHDVVWQFWAALVEQVKSGQGVNTFDLDRGDRGSMKDRRHRLKRCLPESLDEKVRPAGQGTYRLALPADEVCLLHFEDQERLVEQDAGKGRLLSHVRTQSLSRGS